MSGISLAGKKRLFAVSVILLALALLGLATKAKTSRYAAGPKSSTHFSTSVKIMRSAPPVRILAAAPPVAFPGLPPAADVCAELVVLPQGTIAILEPVAGLPPLRAPPSCS